MCRPRLRRATKEGPDLNACRNWSISAVMKPTTDLNKLFEISVWVNIMKTCWSRRCYPVSQLNRLSKMIPVDIKFVCKIWTINSQFQNRGLHTALRANQYKKLYTLSRAFHSLYKVGRNCIIVFKEFNNRKKYLQWSSTWCKRLLLVQESNA